MKGTGTILRRFAVAATSGLALLFAGIAGNAVEWDVARLFGQPSLWVATGLALTAAVVEVLVRRDDPSPSPVPVPDNASSAAKGRGAWKPGEDGYWFQGRVVALEEISAWLTNPIGGSLLIVTGEAGSGKSAILGRVWTTADRKLRPLLPSGDSAIKAPVGSIAVVVDCRGLAADDVATVIASAAGAEPPRAATYLPVALQRRLKRRGKPFVVVVDSLDEATGPVEVRRLVQDLAEMDPVHQVRILLGTRKRWRHEPLVDRFDGARIIDLDPDASGRSRYFQPRDLERYVLARLQQERDGNPYRDDEVAAPVAQRIAGAAGTNFLVAGLTAYSHGRHDSEPVDPAAMRVPSNLREALDQYLERVPPLEGQRSGVETAVRPKDALKPLAYAVPPGMPVSVWRTTLHYLTGVLTDHHALEQFARESAVDYLVEHPAVTDDPGDGPIYRLFHQALNDTIIDAPADDPRVIREQGMITEALLSFGSSADE